MKTATFYYAVNSEYSILVHDRTGKLQRIVRRNVERKPVTDADKQAFLKLIRELFQRQGVPPQAMDIVMNSVQFADNYPAFAQLIAGPASSLWVQRIRTAADVQKEGGEFDPQNAGSPVWDVFDKDGKYLGAITMPDHFNPMRIKGNEVYGVWKDTDDVDHIRRIRVGDITTVHAAEAS